MGNATHTGRRVRSAAEQLDVELASAKKHLIGAVGKDADHCQLMVGLALRRVEVAHVLAREIELICIRAAKRGPYQKEDPR